MKALLRGSSNTKLYSLCAPLQAQLHSRDTRRNPTRLQHANEIAAFTGAGMPRRQRLCSRRAGIAAVKARRAGLRRAARLPPLPRPIGGALSALAKYDKEILRFGTCLCRPGLAASPWARLCHRVVKVSGQGIYYKRKTTDDGPSRGLADSILIQVSRLSLQYQQAFTSDPRPVTSDSINR